VTAASPRADEDDARQIKLSLDDPDQFGVLFDRYFAEIHGYAARRIGRDAADDVAAETFLTAFRSRRRFDAGRGTVRAWLYGIATNHMSAYHRQEERAYRFLRRAGETSERAPAEDALADRVVDRVAAGAVRHELAGALADLSRGDRDVLLLIALGGLSHGDVAAALGIPYGTVGSRLNRVRKKLRGLASVALEIGQEDHGNG
jgi:RNA polymerase sigma-70 factor (ECF subfamily)